MKFSVYLIIDAERDLWDIYYYVAQNDSVEKADRLLENLERTIAKLETMPLRGHFPPELKRVSVLEFREIFFKPYRIIYQAIESRVYVHCVLDGRRDLLDLLQERLVR